MEDGFDIRMMVLLQGCVAMEIAGRHGILVTERDVLHVPSPGGQTRQVSGDIRHTEKYAAMGIRWGTYTGQYTVIQTKLQPIRSWCIILLLPLKFVLLKAFRFPPLPAGWRSEKS